VLFWDITQHEVGITTIHCVISQMSIVLTFFVAEA
jgi:hypothetical protein